jgi:hypothetical protein
MQHTGNIKSKYTPPIIQELYVMEDETVLTSLDGGTIGNYDLYDLPEE